VIYLSDGKVVAQGTFGELMKSHPEFGQFVSSLKLRETASAEPSIGDSSNLETSGSSERMN
jgi:hypothetical protein